MNYYISMAFSIAAIITVVISFQIKAKNVLLVLNVISNACYATSLLLVGAFLGAIFCYIAILRGLFYINLHKRPNWYVWATFLTINVLLLITTWVNYEFWFDVVCMFGVMSINYGLWQTNKIVVRAGQIVGSITLLIYNVLQSSYMNIINEALIIGSCAVFIVRFCIDKRRTPCGEPKPVVELG